MNNIRNLTGWWSLTSCLGKYIAAFGNDTEYIYVYFYSHYNSAFDRVRFDIRNNIQMDYDQKYILDKYIGHNTAYDADVIIEINKMYSSTIDFKPIDTLAKRLKLFTVIDNFLNK